MSYTMTMEMPPKASAYIQHRGPSFRAELNSLFIAFVTTEMQREGYEWPGSSSDVRSDDDVMGENVVDMLSGIVKLPDDFDDKNIRAQAALEKYERIS